MKKTLLLFAVLLAMGSTSFAQISNLVLGENSDLSIGVKAGYQTAKLSYDKASITSDFSNHFTFGLFGRITMDRFYVQPEVLYFKTSNVFDASVTGTDSDNLFNLPTGANVNLTLNQMNLQVPIMVGFNIINTDLVTLRAQVGPTANFILQSQTLYDETYSLNDQEYEMEQEEEVTDENFDPKSIAWGVQAGLGVDVMKRFTLDVNYGFGLSKVFNALNQTSLGETFDFSNIDNTKQNMFMITVGIKLL